MRYGSGILLVGLLTAGVANAGESEILRTLKWPRHKEAEQLVFTTQEELAKVWVADGGKRSELPGVEWKHETVVAVFAGEKKSGGYGVTIERVIEADFETSPYILVEYQETAPPQGEIPPPDRTWPSKVVVVGQRGVVGFVQTRPEASDDAGTWGSGEIRRRVEDWQDRQRVPSRWERKNRDAIEKAREQTEKKAKADAKLEEEQLEQIRQFLKKSEQKKAE
ncbi:MAG: protease complex subunit PrcB family protein [Planctomycetota bacterium]|nr:protease complex subunit PrcB family protein [Planctomycetota bacterium]